jgi:hypothetical protein
MLIYSLCLAQLIIWIQTWMLAKKLNYEKSLHSDFRFYALESQKNQTKQFSSFA